VCRCAFRLSISPIPTTAFTASLAASEADVLKQTSPNELTALTLLDAQEIIERGWCQHALEADGGVCAIGAINKALTGNAHIMGEHGPYGALIDAIGSVSIADWNNAPKRTKDEVIEAFGRAAELARAQVSA
jgi:hypothetical protein